jgi:SAM-dependent methyltransferase
VRDDATPGAREPAAAPAGALYDRIGASYVAYRRPDPRIAALIDRAVGTARSVVDVGSGAGSYEPPARSVAAVEPSWTMIRQRRPDAAPVVRAVAERLPFREAAFDVALAVLTIHHWTDADGGLLELARVARRQVVLTWDPAVWSRFWLVADYLPEIVEAEAAMATVGDVRRVLDVSDAGIVPIPWDCTDGFCGAYWRRPERYLDPDARAAISGLARCAPDVVAHAMERLRDDLASGRWTARHGALLGRIDVDLGYRLLVARGARPV